MIVPCSWLGIYRVRCKRLASEHKLNAFVSLRNCDNIQVMRVGVGLGWLRVPRLMGILPTARWTTSKEIFRWGFVDGRHTRHGSGLERPQKSKVYTMRHGQRP